MTRKINPTPESMMPAFRLFWQARNEAVGNGLLSDNWGAIYSCNRIATIMADFLCYDGMSTLSKPYKMHPSAQMSAAAFAHRERGLAQGLDASEITAGLKVEHVLPQREMTLRLGAMIDEGKTDTEILGWLKTNYRLVVLTNEETTELNRRNRSRICPNRMDGIVMQERDQAP